ncbi:hypothetical protein FQN55_005077 [Onygenales sp. PD_40]|nr:hypothetical protein FQN55_005077 [Onygenales sp. PD_40]
MKSPTFPFTKLKSTFSIRSKGIQAGDHAGHNRNRPGIMDRIIALSPVPSIITDDSFKIVEVSTSYLSFSKLSREDCIGVSVYDLAPSNIPAPDIETLRHTIDKAIALKSVCTIDGVEVTPNLYYCNLRVIPIFENGSLVYVKLESYDITDRYTKGGAINESLDGPDTLKNLIDSIQHAAIFMLTPEGKIATWTQSAATLKGYTAEEIIGKHFSIFYSKNDILTDKPGRELGKAIQDGRVEDEGWRYRKDGSKFWANVVISPIYRFNVLIGFSKVTRDASDRKEIEGRLISAYEESAKLKSQFLANMSHEIRTPMHGMLSALTLLKDTELSDKQHELASIIEGSGSTLLRVINDILDYSKLSTGTFSLNSEVVNLEDIHQTSLQECKKLLNPGVTITSEIASDIPQFSKGDPVRYRQILQNLLSNAAKFTESGSIHVSSKLKDDEESFHRVYTEVIDTGIGVPDVSLKRLFDPFIQVFDKATGKQYQGTGLGLSICKNLVDLMGGSIGYHPNPDGKGSVFWFSVRLGKVNVSSPDDSRESSPVGAEPIEELKMVASGKQILLVEDNKISQAVMLKLLSNIGFDRIDAAANGAQALKLLKAKPFSYHAILMDINMPIMDGVEATTEIRQTLKLDLPIIALTANALKGDAETYISKGMNAYIPKPVNRARLVKSLLAVLK